MTTVVILSCRVVAPVVMLVSGMLCEGIQSDQLWHQGQRHRLTVHDDNLNDVYGQANSPDLSSVGKVFLNQGTLAM